MGVRLSDVPEDDQKGVSALNVTHAPMLRCCMRANQTAKGAIWRSRESRRIEHRRGEGGRMSLAPANALKHAKRLKRKMAGTK